VTVALLSTSIIAAVWAGAMLTPPGRIAYVYLFAYSEFYMGVLTLVSLSITVMLGLVATDRMVLSVRQRVLMQSAHRTTGVIAVFALVVHVTTKLSMGRMAVIDVFVPFLARNQTLYIGLGTTAGFLMVSVLWTGIVRARFAGRGKPWMWRSLHSAAYLAWPIALVHGLSVGRAAAGWVIASYIICVLFVLVALAVRLSVGLGRRKDFSSSSTSAMKPVGKVVPTVTPGATGRPRRRSERPIEVAVQPVSAHVGADRGNVEDWAQDVRPMAPVTARQSNRPVSSGPIAPVTARPAQDFVAEDPYRPPRRTRRDPDEYAEPRRRYAEPEARYVDDEPPPPRRRYAAEEQAPPRGRRYVEPEARYDEVPAQRSRRRYAEDDEPVAPRGRRVEEDDRYETPRRRRSAEPEPRGAEPPRPRFAPDDEPVAPRSRSTEVARYEPPPSRQRYPEQDEPVAPRGRRYSESQTRQEPARQESARQESARQEPARREPIRQEPARREPVRQEMASPRYDEVPAPRPPRYLDDVEPAPRARGDRSRADRGGYGDRERPARPAGPARPGPSGFSDRPGGFSDAGRHSRAGVTEPSERWGAEAGVDPNYLPPDDTPTLVDMASRRARRDADPPTRGTGRGGRRRGGRAEESPDELYFRQLRGEAR
jgi:hypothetical protein